MFGLLSSNSDLNVAIIGASGAIGSSFTNQLTNLPQVKKVFAFARSDITLSDLPKAHINTIDITDEESTKNAASQIDVPLDLILITTGVLHSPDMQPEKSVDQVTEKNLSTCFRVNTIGPMMAIKHFSPLLSKDRASIVGILSARVGSTSDNHLGGWYSYRASKAALNMLIKTTAIELARKNQNAAIIGLHPGTVDSKLSKPFQSFVKEGKLFTPDFAAESLLKVIDRIVPSNSGRVYAWDGAEIPA